MTTDALRASPSAVIGGWRIDPASRWLRPQMPAAELAGLLAKAAFDRIIAGLLLLLLLPLLLVIALLVLQSGPGPTIFRQRRHGLGGSEFIVFKFRTMHAGGVSEDGRVQTRRGDGRITPLGEFLRRTSLDELPQLFNVLNGTMSLVGPRPHPVAMRTEDRLCEEIVPDYAQRHSVKPGITGWAQIRGHRGATDTADQLRLRVEHDLHYVKHRSFAFDLKILLLTPISILFDRDNAF